MQLVKILESTNSLISLLAEVSDPLFFLGVLRDALSQYLACFPDVAESQASATSHTAESAMNAERSRASGYLFGLNGMGMCILKLPKEVVEVEARRLASVITDVSPRFLSSMPSSKSRRLWRHLPALHDKQQIHSFSQSNVSLVIVRRLWGCSLG